MSKRIDQAIDVLAEVWARKHAISSIRRQAEVAVATRYGTEVGTVHAALTRGLEPFVEGSRDFDDLLARWLYADDQELRRVLLARAVSVADRTKIETFFASPGWQSAAGQQAHEPAKALPAGGNDLGGWR